MYDSDVGTVSIPNMDGLGTIYEPKHPTKSRQALCVLGVTVSRTALVPATTGLNSKAIHGTAPTLPA